jgi:hypothetical protein
MQTGRLKVFDHLSDWLEEFRLYHRKNGRIVDERRHRYDLLIVGTSWVETGRNNAITATCERNARLCPEHVF